MILKGKSELTVKEVADLFGYHDGTVRRKIHQGEIPAMKRDKYYIPAKSMYKIVSTLMLALSNIEIKEKDTPSIYSRTIYTATLMHPELDLKVRITFDVKVDYIADNLVDFNIHILKINGAEPNASGKNCIAKVEVRYDDKNLIEHMYISKKWIGENDYDSQSMFQTMGYKWKMVIYWIANYFILKFHREEMRDFIPQLEEKGNE